MVYRTHSREVEELVLWHREQGHFSDKDICYIFDVSLSSLNRWHKNVDDYGDVIRPRNPIQGHPPALSAPQLGDLLRAIDGDPSMFLSEICDWIIISHDVGIHKGTVQCILNDCSYSYKLLCRAATEQDPDDCTIFRRYGWAPRGERAQIEAQFIRGNRYSVVEGLAVDGPVATRVVEGSVNGAELFDFIVEDILPHMNPFPGDMSVLLLDNCAIHKSDYLRQIVEAQGI
ncbi:hypothetical protein PENSPDRAFT_546551, partial [Peniophora sp. CONT]